MFFIETTFIDYFDRNKKEQMTCCRYSAWNIGNDNDLFPEGDDLDEDDDQDIEEEIFQESTASDPGKNDYFHRSLVLAY